MLSEGRGEGGTAGNASGNDARQVQMRMNIAEENMALKIIRQSFPLVCVMWKCLGNIWSLFRVCCC